MTKKLRALSIHNRRLELIDGVIIRQSVRGVMSAGIPMEVNYEVPKWCQSLQNKPSRKVSLAMNFTPIHPWKMSEVGDKWKVFIKRDDLTGGPLTGNKVRKLEFLLADVLQNKVRHVLTCGGVQSNHCRATSLSCVQLGLQCHLYLTAPSTDVPRDGNLLLDTMAGVEINLVTTDKGSYLANMSNLNELMNARVEQIRQETGEECCIIPCGGSNKIGVWGYIEAFNEIYQQIGDRIDDIVCAVGSGGTAGGLAIANYLLGSPYRIHAVSVCRDGYLFYDCVDELLSELGLTDVKSRDIVTIYDQFVGPGYGIASSEQVEYVCRLARETGMILDTSYTGKAAYALRLLLENGADNTFKGNRILFLHTGGVFGLHHSANREVILEHATEHTPVNVID